MSQQYTDKKTNAGYLSSPCPHRQSGDLQLFEIPQFQFNSPNMINIQRHAEKGGKDWQMSPSEAFSVQTHDTRIADGVVQVLAIMYIVSARVYFVGVLGFQGPVESMMNGAQKMGIR